MSDGLVVELARVFGAEEFGEDHLASRGLEHGDDANFLGEPIFEMAWLTTIMVPSGAVANGLVLIFSRPDEGQDELFADGQGRFEGFAEVVEIEDFNSLEVAILVMPSSTVTRRAGMF